jgi:hypothetical protein
MPLFKTSVAFSPVFQPNIFLCSSELSFSAAAFIKKFASSVMVSSTGKYQNVKTCVIVWKSFLQTKGKILKNHSFPLDMGKLVWKKKEIKPKLLLLTFIYGSIGCLLYGIQAIFVLTVGHASQVDKSHPVLLLIVISLY